jgi:hypothetical protein
LAVKTEAVLILTAFLTVICATAALQAQEVTESSTVPATEQSPATASPDQRKVAQQKGVVAHAAEEHAVTGTASLSVLNQYVSRGYQLSKDSIIIQPYISASYKGFSASLWGNFDSHEEATPDFTPDRRGRSSFNETDLTLSYSRALDKWSFTGGYVYYDLRYQDQTEEFFGSASYDCFLKPTLSVYRDIRANPGWYLNLSLSHSFKIYNEVRLDLTASAGYQSGTGSSWDTFQAATGDYTGPKYRAFHDGLVKVGLTIPVVKKVTIQPLLAYSFPLSNDAQKRVAGNSFNPQGYLKSLWQVGVAVAHNF